MLACLAVLAMVSDAPPAPPAAVTFSEQIAPIIERHCVSCHQSGGGAPFSLQSYGDVRRRAALIAALTERRQMPPWRAESGPRRFIGERRLTEAEIAVIGEWVRQGAPEGKPGTVLSATRSGEWQLGPPDLVLRLPQAYRLPAEGPDVFRTFVLAVSIDRPRTVAAFELRTGGSSGVHHASVKFDATRSSRELDEADAEPGYDGGGGRGARFPDGHFLSWTPGQHAQRLPAGMGWTLQPGVDLVLELHLTPTGREEAVDPSIGLYFSDLPPQVVPVMLRLGSQVIDIPPGDADYLLEDTFVLPADAVVVAMQPHAHSLARRFTLTARRPDGSSETLLTIPDWDPRWQEVYRYTEPLPLPRGTSLTMRFTYDNSAANARNPHRPPTRVTFGQSSDAEMGNVWVQMLALDPKGRRQLDTAIGVKLFRDDLQGAEAAAAWHPADGRLRSELGLLYARDGRTDDAIRELQAAVRLLPERASTHYALGTVLLLVRRPETARAAFVRALAIDPRFAAAHVNLGVIEQAAGRLELARTHYEAALRTEPLNVEALYNLGRVFTSEKRVPDAIAVMRRSLAISPRDPAILASLGSLLATTGAIDDAVGMLRRALAADPEMTAAAIDLSWLLATRSSKSAGDSAEAVRLAEEAASRTGHSNPVVLDALVVAYLASGRVAEARQAATLALQRAIESGVDEAVVHARMRLASLPPP